MLIDRIVNWAKDIPEWQSHALRLIWTSDPFGENHRNEVLSILLAKFGVVDPSAPPPTPVRFTSSDISAQTPGGPRICLRALCDVSNANLLAPNQKLNFEPKGLTLIYGDNATGKSGYSRVLKRMCRARGEAESVLPDVTRHPIKREPAKASVEISVDGTPVPAIPWTDGISCDERLAEIAVFDSRAARAYVNDKNQIEYQPYGLAEMRVLVQTCDSIRFQLKEKIDSLPGDVPEQLAPLLKEGEILSSVSSATTDQELAKLGDLSAKEEDRLHELRKTLSEIRSTDPETRARTIRNLKARVDHVRQSVLLLRRAMSSNAVRKLRSAIHEIQVAQDAARAISIERFSREPLQGVGTSQWKVMFEAAKRFSEEVAYPEKAFPFTDDGSRCVLCMQPLAADGKQRLVDFWNFISEDVQDRIASSKKKVELQVEELSASKDTDAIVSALKESLEGEFINVANDLMAYYGLLSHARESLIAAAQNGESDALQPFSQFPPKNLSDLSKDLSKNAKTYENSADREKLTQLESELSMLSVRATLRENRTWLQGFRDRLVLRQKLQKCFDAAATGSITTRIREFVQAELTDELIEGIREELRGLGVTNLALEIGTFGEKGNTYQEYRLPDVPGRYAKVEDVFSEGEHRALGLASFLAELRFTDNDSGIILDDPVRSLDHKWSMRCADRLAKEGERRQVIIFTHDLFFFEALKDYAEMRGVPFISQTIYRLKEKCGICQIAEPTDIRKLDSRIRSLQNHLVQIRKLYESDNPTEYGTELRSWYGELRGAWERFIEEVLFKKVVMRFQRNIKPLELRYVSFEDGDYKVVTLAYAKCSTWASAHVMPDADRTSPPDPSAMAADLQDLVNLKEQVKQRQRENEKRRTKGDPHK